ncbi:MAG: TrmH family RNA methyltransferase [Bdellovibrionaceae bacterium]|nr:TrmH family RNA methyltransferase [Pseudobdellovibrionaceae bacterium]
MIAIQSADNANFKRWKTLSSSRGLRKNGEFILMGEKLVREFLRDPGAWNIKAELVPAGRGAVSSAKAYEVSSALFKELDVLGTDFNLLVLQAPSWPAADLSVPARGLELVCPLGDPSNLGAVVRSARAFGVKRIILTEEAAHPLHPKSVKASAGAVLGMDFSLSGPLKDYVAKGPSYALDMRGESVAGFAWPANLRLLLGEEGPGVPATLKSLPRLSVPTSEVESLNATVAASIALYAWKQSRPR